MAGTKQSPARSSTGKSGQGAAKQGSQPGATQAATNQSSGPTVDQIQMRAFELYIEGGRQEGMSEEHWSQAEAELRGSR